MQRRTGTGSKRQEQPVAGKGIRPALNVVLSSAGEMEDARRVTDAVLRRNRFRERVSRSHARGTQFALDNRLYRPSWSE